MFLASAANSKTSWSSNIPIVPWMYLHDLGFRWLVKQEIRERIFRCVNCQSANGKTIGAVTERVIGSSSARRGSLQVAALTTSASSDLVHEVWEACPQ